MKHLLLLVVVLLQHSSYRYTPILNVIGKGEGGYTSIAPGDENPNLTSMTIEDASKAVGLQVEKVQLVDIN